MLEFRNVVDVTYGAYVISGAYSGINGMTSAPDRDEAVAIIRELLDGNISAIYRSAHDASTAVSMVQMFCDAADTIGEKLAAMKELAEKASSPDYSQGQVEEMQKEFAELAGEINQIVDSTEYNFNKLFSAEGEAISISIGCGSTIDIFAKDLSFSAEGLDLTTDPAGALTEVENAIADLNDYATYLDRQSQRLANATAIIEFQLEAAVGVDVSDFTAEYAMEVAAYAASMVSQNASMLYDVQADIEPDRALWLLADRV
ncbi:MAG: flagellin [Planctomycetota bacterium]